MFKQVKLHNEVNLVGRMIDCKNIEYNNIRTIELTLAIPNDDIKLEPNILPIYIYDDGKISSNFKKYQAIAINGHIENNNGQHIIADVLSIIKEPLFN